MMDDPYRSAPLERIPGGCSEARNVAIRVWYPDGSKIRIGGRSCIKFQKHRWNEDEYQFWIVGIERDWDSGLPLGAFETSLKLPPPQQWILSKPSKMRSDNVKLRGITINYSVEPDEVMKLQLCFLMTEYEDNGKHFIKTLQQATQLRENY